MSAQAAAARRARIAARASGLRFGTVIRWLVVGVFVAVGWLAGKLWFVLVVAASAVAEGWIAARPDKPG
jgi:hypothetical protein